VAVNKTKIFEQAHKYTAKGQFDKAISEYQRIVKAEPGDIRTWLKIGDLYTRKGARKEATETYLKVAEHYTKSGFFLKAVAVYKQVIKLDPTLLEVHELLAKSYLDLGLSSEALIQLEQLADMYQRTSRNGEMLGVLLRMGEIDPHNIATRLRIAEHLSKEDRIPEAVEHFAAACSELKAQGRSDDYVKVAERLLYHDSTLVEIAREVARIYVERGQYKRALSRLQLCFVKDPKDLRTLELLAKAFHGLEQPEKSVSVYREMAVIQKEQGDHGAYVETMRSILAIDPSDDTARAAVQGSAVGQTSSFGIPSPRRHSSGPSQDGLWSPADALSGFGGESTPDSASIEVIPDSQVRDIEELSPEQQGATGAMTHQLSEAEIDERSKKILSETEVLLKYGLKERASEHLRRVFDLDPYNIDAREKLKDLLLELGSTDEALDQLFLLADVFKETQPEGSVYYLHEVLKIAPSNELARQMIADLGGVMPEELDSEPAPATPDASTFVGGGVLELEEENVIEELEFADIEEASGWDEPALDEEIEVTGGVYEPTIKDLPFEEPKAEVPSLVDAPKKSARPTGLEHLDLDSNAGLDYPPIGETQEFSSDVLVAEDDLDEDDAEILIDDNLDDDLSLNADVPMIELDEDLGSTEYDDYLTGRKSQGLERANQQDHLRKPEPDDEPEYLEPEPDDEPEYLEPEPDDEPEYLEPEPDDEPSLESSSSTDLFVEKTLLEEEMPPSRPSRSPTLPPSDLATVDSWESLSGQSEELADEKPADEKPAAVSWADLSAEAAEVEFFLDQSLFDEAEQIIDELELAHPGHPTLAALKSRLPSSSVVKAPAPERATSTHLSSDGLFNVSDLPQALDDDTDDLGSTSLDERMSGQFRVEVKDHVDDADFATHFDLGMAYKEMGLSEEAILEFTIAAGDPSRAGQAKMMIGLCHVIAGNHDEAIRVFEASLAKNNLTLPDRLGLLYELGKLHEESGRREPALECYKTILSEDPSFADVAERMTQLQ
jgi:tetratricopeptide (TPR) repeat protein